MLGSVCYLNNIYSLTKDSLKNVGVRHRHLWAARLKRVFNIDMKTCEACGGAIRVVSCIDHPVVINKILSHLHMIQGNQISMPASRAPPVALLLS